MPELRWILLGAGLIFLAVLAVWESRRQRRLPPQAEAPTQHRFREPTLGLPEMRPRESAQGLPVLEIDESMMGLRIDGVRIEQDMVAVDAPSSEPPAIAEPPERVEELVYEAAPAAPADESPQLPVEPAIAEPIVEWPPDGERRLISLRVAAKAGERLSGRTIRLALGAEGFVHGKYAIFHKAGPDAHVVVSAASLTKPGCFDLDTMDSQRYGGLGLFTILPGHLPPQQMLDELLESAHNIAERVEGAMQDERGAPLDAQGIAALRAAVQGEPQPPVLQGAADPPDSPS